MEIPESLNSFSENIFSSAIDLIFSDKTHNFHDSSDLYIIYKFRRFGNIRHVLGASESEDRRKLFAHYL